MKMNGQSRTFVKQVKLDLLALSNIDLFQIIQQWVWGNILSEQPADETEKIWSALGYTRENPEIEHFIQLDANIPDSASWSAPNPESLRTRIAEMDEQQFAQYVISIAFQTLHPRFPEWYDGLTFNAHLANYLRQISSKRRTLTSDQNI
jgi:hypothetical protein